MSANFPEKFGGLVSVDRELRQSVSLVINSDPLQSLNIQIYHK